MRVPSERSEQLNALVTWVYHNNSLTAMDDKYITSAIKKEEMDIPILIGKYFVCFLFSFSHTWNNVKTKRIRNIGMVKRRKKNAEALPAIQPELLLQGSSVIETPNINA